ncbi:MAG TPA: hypothetical protein VMG81_06920 [Thermoplasmata archaeon]|nr:hypothetical protein [Thermoplasmata archaeon]
MSVLRVVPVSRRALGVSAVVLLAVLLGAGGLAAGAPSARGALPGGPVVPCSGPPTPANYSGSVVVLGGPVPASTFDGLPLEESAALQETVTVLSNGTLISESCSTASAPVQPNASGAFAFAIVPANESCTTQLPWGIVCASWSGPYGPVALAIGPVPSGYTDRVLQNGTRFTVDYAADLASVAVVGGNASRVTAPGQSVAIGAQAWSGLGTPALVAAAFAWSVSGPGWTVVPGPGNASTAVVTAPPAPGPGTLSVAASGTIDGGSWSTPAETVPLAAVATAGAGAGVNRSEVDPGGSVELYANATGPPGAAYTALFATGAGGVPLPAACQSAPLPNGSVAVGCSAVATFPANGTYDPTANVTDGRSGASIALPPVRVVRPPAVELDPAAPIGYVGVALAFTLSAASDAGVLPFRAACLASGEGSANCSRTPGPTWSFVAYYPAAGAYTAEAWLVDGDGHNGSTTVPVRIVPPLAVTIPTGPGSAVVGVPLSVVGDAAGGVGPLAYWWNDSLGGPPVAHGTGTADGPVPLALVPSTSGAVRFTLTVVDALGTHANASTVVVVAPAPATAVAPLPGATEVPVVAGSAASIGWEAVDGGGAAVPSFAASAELVLERTNGSGAVPAWVNASGIGPLPSSAAGAYAVPADAWAAGRLQLTVTPAASGTFSVALEGGGLPGSVAPVTLDATPDIDHLALVDPSVAVPGLRTNATRWSVLDRFGDPAVGASVIVELAGPGGETATVEPVTAPPAGLPYVWVNYSAGPGTLTVRVLDLAGEALLGPIGVPALAGAPAPFPALVPLAVGVPFGIGVAGVAAIVGRRPTRPAPRALEDELERLAEGRATVLAIVGAQPGTTAAAIASAWDPPPAPPELDDWIASLVTDGTLTETRGPLGVPTFAPAPGPAERPLVTLDEEALERAIARRDADAGGPEPDRPP